MERRQFIVAAGAIGSAAGCLSTTTTQPTNNSSEPAARVDNPGVVPQQTGIDEVVWRAPNRESIELVIKYHKTAPGFVRLVDPGGSESWRNDQPPDGGEDAIPFGSPVGPQGDWTISATTDGETKNLTLVVKRGLRFIDISLSVDELNVSATNTGTVPTTWVSYIIYTGIHSKSMGVGELLLPGQSHEVTHTYPFNQYENVRFHLFDGKETYDQQRVDLL